MKARFLRLALLLAAPFFFLAACGEPDCADLRTFCAGLATDTLGLDDYGANRDTWNALQNLKNYRLLDRADFIESAERRDYEKNIAYFASRHYDAVITVGIGLRRETLRAAARYENVVFIAVNQPFKKDELRLNLIPATFPEDQMGFLAGVLAARLTRTGFVGAACEDSSLEAMWKYCEGFRNGAKFANPEVKPLILYRDDGDDEKLFLDEAWGREAAQKITARGADVLFAAGGITAQGALRAAAESQVKAIGAERDQAATLGVSNEWLVTSIYGDAQFAVENALRGLKGETLNQPDRSPIKFVPLSPKFPESLTPELQAYLAALWNRQISSGVPATRP